MLNCKKGRVCELRNLVAVNLGDGVLAGVATRVSFHNHDIVALNCSVFMLMVLGHEAMSQSPRK